MFGSQFKYFSKRNDKDDETNFATVCNPSPRAAPSSSALEDFALHSSVEAQCSTGAKCLYGSAVCLARSQRILRVHLADENRQPRTEIPHDFSFVVFRLLVRRRTRSDEDQSAGRSRSVAADIDYTTFLNFQMIK